MPAEATVQQVLLYWEGLFDLRFATRGDDTIVVGGHTVTGTSIGGPTFVVSLLFTETFRADITDLGLIAPGANTVPVSGLANSFANNGAGILVIYQQPGESADVTVRDGSDYAFVNFAPPKDTTVPQVFTFPAEDVARTADLVIFTSSVAPDRPNALVLIVAGDTTTIVNPLGDGDGREWDTLRMAVTIPAGADSVSVQLLSQSDGGGNLPASMVWHTAALSVPHTPPEPDPGAVFLIIDEDGIDNGDRYWLDSATAFTSSTIRKWSAKDVNDDRPGLAQRLQLRWFAQHVGQTFWLWTGQVGDEGWFAPKVIPDSWATAGPTADGLRNLLGDPSQPFPHGVGPGLGTGSNPEQHLDKIPHVIPLRAEGLWALRGRTVCALVWDSDISINYDHGKPLGVNGSLKGEKLGVVAFDVLDVVYLPGFSSSTLPRVQVTVRDANEVCGGPLSLYADAPEPKSSSVPMDVRPNDPRDDSGYLYVTR